jgi:hypothetical protein
MVADAFFSNVRYIPGYYPHLLFNLASGRELVASLREFDSDKEAHAILDVALESLLAGTGARR